MYISITNCPSSPSLAGNLGMGGLRGLRGCACGGCGMGQPRGMGLFDTPFDLSTWGWPEWGIAILGGYALFSMIFTSSRAQRSISRSAAARRKRGAKRAGLKAELARTRSELART